MAADLNYVSPLTSDLTDYYTKQEVDELQQGDVDKFATQAQVIAGDNTVKGWVVSQDYLKEHQSLENYATKDYVNTVVSEIEVEGVTIEVVARLPQPQDASANTIYLVLSSASESGNIYDEWIYVPDAEDFELIGNTSSGIIPDLSDYATKTWVGEQGFLTEHQSLLGYATEAYVDSVVEALDIPDISNFVEESELAAVAKSGSYNDLSNKPSIPTVPTNVSAFTNDAGYLTEHQSLANYATKSELNTKANANELSGLASLVSQKANAADLATVATSGSYNDLTNKPTIPSIAGLATEQYVAAAIDDATGDFVTLEDAEAYATKAELSSVATSGSYNDLADKPVIPAAPDLTPYATKAELSSVATSGDYEDLSNKPVIPTVPTLATVATSGSYNDLTDKPTIPGNPTDATVGFTYQLYYANIDDSATTVQDALTQLDGAISSHTTFLENLDIPDVSNFVESSDLATVATSGSYNDLTDKPTIPTQEKVYAYAPRFASRYGYNSVGDNSYFKKVNGKEQILEAIKNGLWFQLTWNVVVDIYPADLGLGENDKFIKLVYNNGVYTKAENLSSIAIFKNDFVGYISPKVFVSTTIENYQDMINLDVYDNTTSGLSATTIQGAIDELAAASGSSSGITVQDVIDEFNENGLTLDNETDRVKVEITSGGITQTGYDENDNPTVKQFLDGRIAYERGTDEGVDWEVQIYDFIGETGLGFGKTVLEDSTTTNEMSLIIKPSRDYDAIEVEMSDTVNDYNDTKTIAFVEDIPSGYELLKTYDVANKSLTLSVVASRA